MVGIRRGIGLTVASILLLAGCTPTTPTQTRASLIIAVPSGGIPAAHPGVAYDWFLEASGGSGGYVWSVTGLPTGLSITAFSGEIAGTPTAEGVWSLSVTLADRTGTTRHAAITFRVTPGTTDPQDGLGAGGFAPFGTVLIPGKTWLGGQGVDVISNGLIGCYNACHTLAPREPHGIAYQCVELVNALLQARGWSPAIQGNAVDIFARASGTYFDKHPSGDGYHPVPGDIIVWGGGWGGYGHVAVVRSVSGNTVDFVEQNAGPDGHLSLTIDDSGRLAARGTLTNLGFLHAKANVAGTTSQPTGPASLAVTLVHSWNSGSGKTDVTEVTPGGVRSSFVSTVGMVAPGTGQFGLGDFNGDGVKDLYFVSTQGDPSGRTAVFVAAGPTYDHFLVTVTTPVGQFSADHGDVMVADFTHDGRADVAVYFANNGDPRSALDILDAATAFQTFAFQSTVAIGGHDGTRSDAVPGDFDSNGSMDVAVGFHKGTPSGKVDLFVMSGSTSWQTATGTTLPVGGWADGQGQLLSGRLGTDHDGLAVVYNNLATGKPDLFALDGFGSIRGSWSLPVGYAPAGERSFVGN